MGKYDFKIAIIGSGAAGMTAAKLAAEAKKSTVLIEEKAWGGADLTTRDVPYAATFYFAKLYRDAINGKKCGLSNTNLRFNYPTVLNWQNSAVRRVGGNDKKALEEMGVTCMKGHAHFLSAHEIAVGDQKITAERCLIATGATLDCQGIAGLEAVECYTPDTALKMPKVPKAVMIVGGGATGCELAQYFATLGAQVLITEATARLLPKMDTEVSAVLEQFFTRKLNIKVLTESQVVALEKDEKSKKVIFVRGGQEKSVRVDTVILATGSKPQLDLGLENAGVKFNEKCVKVDAEMHTSCKNIWAAGDVLGGESSTERATYQASIAASNLINNGHAVANYSGFMQVVDVSPQIVQLGLTELDCQITKQKYKKVLLSLAETSRAKIVDQKIGFVKLLANNKGTIIGATAMMPDAELVLQELAMAIRHGLSVQEIVGTPHMVNGWGDVIKTAAKRLMKAK